MFKDVGELRRYVIENYPEVTDHRIQEEHWDLQCTQCRIVRGFQVLRRVASVETTGYSQVFRDVHAPLTYVFRCPVCKAFKQWIMYVIEFRTEDGTYHHRYFRVTSLPSEGIEEIEELPENPASLRTAYKQAIRAMDANAHLAAAAMFRRALQIITRDLLGAKPGNLANELKAAVGSKFNGVTITNNFAKVAYIVKEAGNQGAHPDEDPDLLDFTADDAADLQNIFMEIVNELFVGPAALQKAKEEFLTRRKIIPKALTPMA